MGQKRVEKGRIRSKKGSKWVIKVEISQSELKCDKLGSKWVEVN